MDYLYHLNGEPLEGDRLDHLKHMVPDAVRDTRQGEKFSDLQDEVALVQLHVNGLIVLARADTLDEFKWLKSLHCPQEWAIIKREALEN
jgi:hypothetical protein